MKKIKQYIKNRQVLTIVISILFLVLGTTFAWLTWASNYTNLNLAIGNIGEVIYIGGQDIEVSNIGPVLDYNDGNITNFSVKKISSNNIFITAYITLTLLPDELKDASFKCAVLSSTDNVNWVEETNDFDFSDKEVGQKYVLLDLNTVNTATKYYKLIIYIDGNMLNPPDMQGKTFEATIEVEITDGVKDFAYTGNAQTFLVPQDGYYQVELWGASGIAGNGGKGGYTKGSILLEKGELIYVYVGEQGITGIYGINATSTLGQGGRSTYNGGGAGGTAGGGTYPYANYYGGASGGGATDIRCFVDSTTNKCSKTSNLSWDNFTGLKNRIMVSGGGGSNMRDYDFDNLKGNAGGLISQKGAIYGWMAGQTQYASHVSARGTEATQTTGYSFGTGGNGANSGDPTYCNGFSAGGGGYYGGYGSLSTGGSCLAIGGAGGSSFISGYAGVNAIVESSTNIQINHNGNTKHYSNRYFINGYMEGGNNTGNGKAKITYIGSKPERVNITLNGVRYIKDCTNTSTATTIYNEWVEIQAIVNGINVAKGATVTGITPVAGSLIERAVDGDISTESYVVTSSTGEQCIIVDLGLDEQNNFYNLDEIAIWRYYGDGRTYNNTKTYVSSDNISWQTIDTFDETETNNGKRISAYRKNNLYTNGYLEIKDNTNFPLPYNQDGYFVCNGICEFAASERIPVDKNKKYQFTLTAKANSTSSYGYAGFVEYDIDKNAVSAQHVMYRPGTLTTLKETLSPGDNVIKVDNLDSFVDANPIHQRSIIFWNYQDSTGYTYPELTYSRNWYQDLWTYGTGLNKTTDTIALKQQWSGPTIPVGTKLSQGNSSSTHNYGIMPGINYQTSWTTYRNNVTGTCTGGDICLDKFKYGTKYVSFFAILNSNNISNAIVNIKDIGVKEIK